MLKIILFVKKLRQKSFKQKSNALMRLSYFTMTINNKIS